MRRNKKGFTLIEVLLVVAILGILAYACGIAVGNSVEDGRIQQALAQARILETAKDSYKLAHPFAEGTITSAELEQYLPNGYTTTLSTPWKNVSYDDVLNLNVPVSFERNGKRYYSNRGDN